MQLAGMLYGSRLLDHVGFPAAEVLGPDASEDAIKVTLDRHRMLFVKPVFKGGVGKKGKAGLIGKATTLEEALAEKERLYFAEHRHGNVVAKANGVTFEAGVAAEHEVYFSITDSTLFRAPTMTLTHKGGVDIEELDATELAQVPFDALTGLKAFVVANALTDIGAPREIISPLVQQSPIPMFGTYDVAARHALANRVIGLHRLAANLLLGLAAAHAAAGLVHYFILRDGVLDRMLPLQSRVPRS